VKQELHAVERAYIRENECVNMVQPGRTRVQYYKDNHDSIRKQQSVHRAAHSEKHDCGCGGHYKTNNKAEHLRTAKHQAFELKE